MPHLTVAVDSLEVLSYAMAHNRVAVVRDIVLANIGDDLGDADVTVSITDSQGPLTQPFLLRADLQAQSTVRLDTAGLRLDPAVMSQVTERRPAEAQVAVKRGDEVLATARQPVEVLPAQHWLSRPEGIAVEMLAAHVMPNAPEVAELLAEVSQILQQHTGDPSIQGYQSGPGRADEIAHAVYAAMQRREIVYSEPPASWSEVGQKVRTPQEVLGLRTGTCLDLSVLMAAALEQAGLRALVFVTAGHAFAGYWREEVTGASANNTEYGDLANRIDLGQLVTIETTLVTARANPAPFEAARNRGRSVLTSGEVVGVLDVFAARRSQILPLPALRKVEGEVQVFEYRPHEHSSAPAERELGAVRPARATPSRQVVQPPRRIQAWKNALLDLSLRNRLINFTERSALRLVLPDGSLPGLEDRISLNKSLMLLPSDHFDDIHRLRLGSEATAAELDPSVLHDALSRGNVHVNVRSERYDSELQKLAHKARTISDETGANNLYLALGSLVWDIDGKPLRSPLILLPVTLKATNRRGGTYSVTLDEAGASTPNYCLLEKLAQVHGFTCPDFADPKVDDAGIDVAAALRALRISLAAAGLPYHVEETAHLGILQFAKFRLWKDLDESWESLVQAPLVRHLALTPTEEFVDPVSEAPQADLDELGSLVPIAADGSQLQAIAEALAGRTFVLEGPPGTGKSQTIANLLARGIAEGQKILFVAEKRAALNVVRDRLEGMGLGTFALDLHDKTSRPTAVRRQLLNAMDLQVEGDRQGLDAEHETLRGATRQLGRYAAGIHAENPAALSLYSAETERLVQGDGPVLDVPIHALRGMQENTVAEVQRALQSLPETADLVDPGPEAPWGFSSVDDPGALDVPAIRRTSEALDTALTRLQGRMDPLLAVADAPDELCAMASALRSPDRTLPGFEWLASPAWEIQAQQLRADAHALAGRAAPVLQTVRPSALLLPLHALLSRAREAQDSFILGKRKRLRAVAGDIGPTLWRRSTRWPMTCRASSRGWSSSGILPLQSRREPVFFSPSHRPE